MNTKISSPITEHTRLHHIDLLKCLAMLFVLMYHGTLYSYDFLANGSPVTFLRFFFRSLLSTCVPLFFFVNGYLLFGKPLDLKRHTKKLVHLVIVVSFWMLFLLLVLQPVKQEWLSWRQVYDMFWSLQMNWNNHLWYMGVLLSIYVFFPLLKQAYDTNRKAFCWFTAASFVLVFGNVLLNEFLTVFNRVVRNKTAVYDDFYFFHILQPYGSGYLGMGMVYFCLGGVALTFQKKIEAIPPVKRNIIAATGLLASCGLLTVLGYGYSILTKSLWDVVWNGYDTVFTLGSVVCLFVLSLNWKRSSRVVRAVSANTLGIYLMHDAFNRMLISHFFEIEMLRTLWGTALYAAVLMALCTGICVILRRIPVLRKLI